MDTEDRIEESERRLLNSEQKPAVQLGGKQLGVGAERGSERNIVTARGTGDGLVIRLDGRAQTEAIRDAFCEFVRNRRKFLGGNTVTLEWLGEIPGDDFVEELSKVARELDVEVAASVLRDTTEVLFHGEASRSEDRDETIIEVSPGSPKRTRTSRGSLGARSESIVSREASSSESTGISSDGGGGLFGGIGGYKDFQFDEEEPKRSVKVNEQRFGSTGVVDPNLWDDADARILFGTVRSGQKLETEHSIVIIGDVNSGAEIVAGGDIVVLGTLRGVAHAGAYEESGGGRVIFALNLQPTQLRIGAVISRGVTSDISVHETIRGPEIARVDGNVIVVEKYQTKSVISRRRDL